jgi:Putative DNA-binding domain
VGDLLEFQRRFIGTLLGTPTTDFELARHPAMETHRRTVFSGLTKALALSFPTIRSLTGPDYFERLVCEFAREHPPHGAVLYDYGAELPAFLETFPGVEGYAYFGDVARFDWLVDQTAHRLPGPSRPPRVIPDYGRVCLPASLTCARFDYAVDLIRDAVELERNGESPAVDVGPNPRWLVLWRSSAGTSVKALSATAWNILNALAAGYDGMSSLKRAAEQDGAARALGALHEELLTSSFIRLNLQEP